MGLGHLKPKFWGKISAYGMVIAIVTFAIDQLHKTWMIYFYKIAEKGRVEITPFFDLVMLWNQGISYGLFQQDSVLGQIFLIVFALVATLALMMWMASAETKFVALSLGLIIGGALGNALDRVIYGAVADFFSFHAFGYYWYVFNIADMAIIAGAAGLVIDMLFLQRKTVV